MKKNFALLAVTVAGAALLSSGSARAALDEVLVKTSSEVVTTQVSGQTLRVRTRANVKEFAGSDGKVFAAVWQGNAAPDLHSLLAGHYAAYETALRARKLGGHNHLFLSTPELTINVISHGRFIAGTVYLGKSMPKGVTIDALHF